jgi:Rha family phage regulatory protein
MNKDKPIIFFEDGIPMTTSLEVARIFVKRHDNIMRAVRNPEIPEDFSNLNFELVEIIEHSHNGISINKSYFKMTRDGFNLIAFGFTGGKAMAHKIEFIYAFNAVVAELERVKLEQGDGHHLHIVDARVPEPPVQKQIRSDDWTRQCAHCRQYLPEKAFNVDNARNPPLQSWCRKCHADRRLELLPMAIPVITPFISKPVAVIPMKLTSPVSRVLAFRTNPPKTNQRSFTEVEMTSDKLLIEKLVRANRELLDFVENRSLKVAIDAET